MKKQHKKLVEGISEDKPAVEFMKDLNV